MPVKVSICIPAYHDPECLRGALESIVIQTWTDYEVVISDDSSDESVGKVVDEFSERLPIRYQRNSPPMGSPENWNECIRQASGDYIQILHHDDWLTHERSLERLVRLLDDNPDASLAFCASMSCLADGTKPRIHRPTQSQLASLSRDPRVLFCDNFVAGPSATIFRSAPTPSFDSVLIWVVDIDFYIRMMVESGVFAYSDEPLVSIMNGLPGRLTARCLADSALQVREYVYLYRKIAKGRAFSWRLFSYLSTVFRRHGVGNVRGLIGCGVPEPVPFALKAALAYAWVLRAAGLVVRVFRWAARHVLPARRLGV